MLIFLYDISTELFVLRFSVDLPCVVRVSTYTHTHAHTHSQRHTQTHTYTHTDTHTHAETTDFNYTRYRECSSAFALQ